MMDNSTLKIKKTAAIYVHGHTEMMPRGKKLLTKEDAQPLIDMVKGELPMLDFVATYVDGNTQENKDTIYGCKDWKALVQDSEKKELDYIVIPSLESLPFRSRDALLLLRTIEDKFPTTKVYFLLENICTADLNFVPAVSFELTTKDWVYDRKIKKNKLIRKIVS